MPDLTEVDKQVAGLYVTDGLNRLCRRWGAAVVLAQVREWVAYMDSAAAISAEHFDGSGEQP